MTIQEIIEYPIGTKFYLVENGRVRSYWLIGKHPKGENYLLMGSTANVETIKVFYIPKDTNRWQVSYDIAKELMWEDYIAEGKSIDKIFFDGLKNFMNESTRNSSVDDGTGIPSSNQGKLQSDSEVQQGDKGQGSGVSDDRQESGSDGECTSYEHIRTRPNQDS